MSGGNGRLTYIGASPVYVHCALSVSMTCAGSNKLLHLRMGVNGTTDPASEAQNKISSGGDVQSTALHLVTRLTTGDYISAFVRNSTSAHDVTVECANIQIMSMTE